MDVVSSHYIGGDLLWQQEKTDTPLHSVVLGIQ